METEKNKLKMKAKIAIHCEFIFLVYVNVSR